MEEKIVTGLIQQLDKANIYHYSKLTKEYIERGLIGLFKHKYDLGRT